MPCNEIEFYRVASELIEVKQGSTLLGWINFRPVGHISDLIYPAEVAFVKHGGIRRVVVNGSASLSLTEIWDSVID